jgi:hypothetical protein
MDIGDLVGYVLVCFTCVTLGGLIGENVGEDVMKDHLKEAGVILVSTERDGKTTYSIEPVKGLAETQK